jgi:ankyrin repeat protein
MSADASPTPDPIREFVIAGHGNLPRVKEMLAADPSLLNASYPWAENDRESAIQAAAHAGAAAVAEFLLAQGAPLAIYTAAMLGQKDKVEQMLADDPELVRMNGAHAIPLLPHAAWSGDLELVKIVYERGARDGVSYALHNAVMKNHLELARWLLGTGAADPGWKNFEGKTVLAVAVERGRQEIAALLKAQGAQL